MATPPPRLWYFNIGFDLRLGRFPLDHLQRTISEASWIMIPALPEEDAVIVDQPMPPAHRQYLHQAGCPLPDIDFSQKHHPQRLGSPWGWDEEARQRLSATGCNLDHPSPFVVQAVNSRVFSHFVSRSSGLGTPGARLISDPRALEAVIRRMPRCPLVVKPLHGSTGIGFLHISGSHLEEQQRRSLDQLFARHGGGVIIEPWLERSADYSSALHVGRDGSLSGIRHHHTLSGSTGIFFGVELRPHGTPLPRWQEELDRSARLAGKRLHEAGYWGPVGLDAFSTPDPEGGEQLISLVDINARQAMSLPAYGLQRKLAPDRHCLLRLMRRKRCRLPRSHTEIKEKLAELAWDPTARRGVLLVTPPEIQVEDQLQRPRRSAFFLAAESEQSLGELHECLMKRLSSRKPS